MQYHPAVSRHMHHYIVESLDLIHMFLSDAQGLLNSDLPSAIPLSCYDALTLAYKHIAYVNPFVMEYSMRTPTDAEHLHSILNDLRAWADAIDLKIQNDTL